MDATELRQRTEEVAGLLRALANPNRLMIVCTLVEGERSVASLERELGIRQPTLSQQLTALRTARVVEARRESRTVIYRLAEAKAAKVVEALHAIYCDMDTAA